MVAASEEEAAADLAAAVSAVEEAPPAVAAVAEAGNVWKNSIKIKVQKNKVKDNPHHIRC